MNKYLVLGLEGVLVTNDILKELHPEAQEILRRARNDFQGTSIWSNGNLDDCWRLIGHHGLFGSIDAVIAPVYGEYSLAHPRGRKVTTYYVTDKKRIPLRESDKATKDLTLIGNPNEMVLIDAPIIVSSETIHLMWKMAKMDIRILPPRARKDQIFHNGYPPDRVVYIDPYDGEKPHSLTPYYNQALQKF